MNPKLHGLPKVYWLTLERSYQRQEYMNHMFKKHGIEEHVMVNGFDAYVEDFRNSGFVNGNYFEQMKNTEIAISMSHIKMIKQWYDNEDSEYGFFAEDDLNLDVTDEWNFSWNDFVERTNFHWNVIQLVLVRVDPIKKFGLEVRTNKNWSACAYILKRDYARRLIEDYYQDGRYVLKLKGDPNAIPYAENVIYFLGEPHTYTIPLFLENVDYGSNFFEGQNSVKSDNMRSHIEMRDWWNKYGSKMSIDKIMNMANYNRILRMYGVER
jgi:hypothetical protein